MPSRHRAAPPRSKAGISPHPGPELKRLRLKLKLSQPAVARAFGVSHAQWQRYENQRSCPSSSRLAYIRMLAPQLLHPTRPRARRRK